MTERPGRVCLVTILLGLALASPAARAQEPPASVQPEPTQPAQAPAPLATPLAVELSATPATLTFFNRPILVLRARVLGREPIDRATAARSVLKSLAASRTAEPVTSRPMEGGMLVSVGSRVIVAVTSLDVDVPAGETVEGAADQAVTRLRQALSEFAEARSGRALLRSSIVAGIALAIGAFLLWVIARSRKSVSDSLFAIAVRRAGELGLADRAALGASHLLDYQRSAVTAVAIGLQILILYGMTTVGLEAFPYTRQWGESLGGFLGATVAQIGLGMLGAIPGLFTVLLILLVTLNVVRLLSLWFNAVERGSLKPGWLHQEIVRPTRRLVTTFLWIFAIVVSYPYLPGSSTGAFKGVSVFLGLMVTIGSSGFMNQIMSGFMVMYSRALKIGHFVRVGDVEGTVVSLGVLSVKIRTLLAEEITVPNSVVVSQMTKDYSRLAETTGVLTPISVTIGYDAPWRQVHALLLRAAERTPGIRRQPAPHVLQSSLEDFYVRYTLYVSLDRQDERLTTMNALFASIQDQFNEHGVQIMSPNYMLDPPSRKVVSRQDWYAAPARPEGAKTED